MLCSYDWTPQTLSHNHIKIKGIKIIGSKNTKTPRALNFINQFASRHQLVHQTQQSHDYNHKGKITIK